MVGSQEQHKLRNNAIITSNILALVYYFDLKAPPCSRWDTGREQ